jgi:hypothetical protein
VADGQLWISNSVEWNSSTPKHRTEFDILHLLPTWVSVFQFNCWRLVASAKPVLQCLAKHNHTEAKNVKSDDADRQKKFYLLKRQRLCLLTMYRLQRVGEWISVYCEKIFDLTKVLILAAIFQLWYLLNLMDIQDLKHLHWKVSVLLGSQLYQQ